MHRIFFTCILASGLVITLCTLSTFAADKKNITPVLQLLLLKNKHSMIVQLGRELFFDSNLSTPPGQSCADCHDPGSGFAAPDVSQTNPVSEGAVAGRFGNRNAPTVSYAMFSPVFRKDTTDQNNIFYVGGQFLDGRAANLVEQAKGPFLNPKEMANPDKATVVNKVRSGTYASLFLEVFGADAFDDTESAYTQIAEAIAEFEKSPVFRPFSSKYDFFLRDPLQYPLTNVEKRGMQLFNGLAKCNLCHTSTASANGTSPLFTDFTYSNIGVPKNPSNPVYSEDPSFTDHGLGGVLNEPAQNGKFKVPTLRNVALTAPYMHNGAFATLEEVMDLYNNNRTDLKNNAEVPDNISGDVGDLFLTNADKLAIVAFLKTLTDGSSTP